MGVCLSGCADRPSAAHPALLVTPAPRARVSPEVRQLVQLVNRHRASRGLPRLVWHDRLASVARAHSEDMARRGFFSHTNPDGESPFDRMRDAGLRFRAAAENIAEGQTTARAVFESWMRSPGHRRNLESAAYTHHGIAVIGNHWTHLFMTPR